MPDRILIRDLHLRTIIGINPEERVNRQDVLINLVLETDIRPAARADSIELALNYRTITKQVIELVEGTAYLLVERLAEEVAALCLTDSRVQAVEVTIEKPGAVRFARSVGVSIRREQVEG
ncbi:MAG: dihydroneopterin aldolase [Planctomycetaceae bacterium]